MGDADGMLRLLQRFELESGDVTFDVFTQGGYVLKAVKLQKIDAKHGIAELHPVEFSPAERHFIRIADIVRIDRKPKL